MHQAIPYRSWLPHPPRPEIQYNFPTTSAEVVGTGRRPAWDDVRKTVLEQAAVVVCARRGCCMGHVVRRLLLDLGANPAVYEVEEEDEVAFVEELQRFNGGIDGKVDFPAVFIGGKLFGGLDRVMASHITGDLIPILKEAGALWL